MRLLKTPSVLPGFNISLGITVLCLSLLVVLPFAMMAVTAAGMGFSSFGRPSPSRACYLRVADAENVLFRHADQHRFRHADGMGAGSL